MIKKALSLGLILISSPLFAYELTSFDAIMHALSSGKEVSVVMHSKQCKITDPNEIKLGAFKNEVQSPFSHMIC